MYRRFLLFVMLVPVLPAEAFAAGGATPSSDDCRAPVLQAFSSAVNDVLKQTNQPGKDQDELWSSNKTFIEWGRNPKKILPQVEAYLGCSPTRTVSQVQLVSVALTCLDLNSQLAYIKHLSKAPKTQSNEWALHFAVAPGPRWSTRLARQYADASVQSALKEVMRSPNATPGLQAIVGQILGGGAKADAEKNRVSPLVKCGEGSAK